MPFPIPLLLSLPAATTMIGIIQVTTAQMMPVGSPPRPSMTHVRPATEFRKEALTEYGPMLSAVLYLLTRMHTTIHIRAATSDHPENVPTNSPPAQVPVGILLPVT